MQDGRIQSIIEELERINNKSLKFLPTKTKIDALCDSLLINYSELDEIISKHSPVLRTVKGHSFEVAFKKILEYNGYTVEEIGGDSAIDLKVNGKTLQLKTPNLRGSTKNFIEYKTHKTHGAKSEKESITYYHSVDEFADYFIGLISYSPFRLFIIEKNKLPRHINNHRFIKSPFKLPLYRSKGHLSNYINSFDSLNIRIQDDGLDYIYPTHNEFLPLSSKTIGLNSEIIIDSIFREGNFRIWDMSIRGFAREFIFQKILNSKKIKFSDHPENYKTERGEKADLAVFFNESSPDFIQIKGLSLTNCKFNGKDSVLAIETQLTRGRINDHPTQSRLYKDEDFNFLVLCIDPSLSNLVYGEKEWKIYLIPSRFLKRHSVYKNRYNAIQKFNAQYISKFLYSSYSIHPKLE